MQDLPQDVWELVAAHLSQKELMPLVSFNRALLNIVLNMRFGEVEWSRPNLKLVKNLIRISDPFIAKRVKHLCIRNSLMQQLLRDTSDFEDPMPCVYGLMGRLYGLIVKSHAKSRCIVLDGIEDRPRDILHLIAQTITGMTNLRVFALECSGLSLYKDTQRILESIRNVYNPDLHKVILHGTWSC